MKGAATLAFSLIAAAAAQADSLVSGLSQDQIQITSSYTGTELTVFGAIQSSENEAPAGTGDVIVVVRGPDTDMVVRRKVRIAGVWINKDSMTLYGMPAFYFIASTRPLKEVTAEETLQRYQLGLSMIVQQSASTHSPPKAEPYRLAAIRARARDGLYHEESNTVEYLPYPLFRLRVAVPASVPPGRYITTVYYLRDGMVIGAQSTPFDVGQAGLERKLYNFAHNDAVLYGIIAVLMAVVIGWLSSVAFRRSQ